MTTALYTIKDVAKLSYGHIALHTDTEATHLKCSIIIDDAAKTLTALTTSDHNYDGAVPFGENLPNDTTGERIRTNITLNVIYITQIITRPNYYQEIPMNGNRPNAIPNKDFPYQVDINITAAVSGIWLRAPILRIAANEDITSIMLACNILRDYVNGIPKLKPS